MTMNKHKNKALFLDRDGIINEDFGYVYRYQDIVWIRPVFEMIKLANARGYKVIVLTNQSGIHSGKYSHDDVCTLHGQMNDYLSEAGAHIDGWFYCAEMDSDCRKPRPGMLLSAQEKFDIDLAHSFMVGDKVSDVFLTEGICESPVTFLVRGNYDLKSAVESEKVRIFSTHQEVLAELKLRL